MKSRTDGGFGVIFDMDDVLVDSNKIIWNSFNKLLEPFKIHLSNNDIKQRLGNSLRDNINIWNKKHKLTLNLEEFSKKSWGIQLRSLEKMDVDKNLIALLETLKSNKILMGVGTSSQKFRADKILDILKIKDYFSAVITASDIINHKPNPDLFLEAAKRLGIPPEKCIVIEDAESGIEATKRGNMKSIGLLTKYNSKNNFDKADLIIKDFSELSYDKLKNLIQTKNAG